MNTKPPNLKGLFLLCFLTTLAIISPAQENKVGSIQVFYITHQLKGLVSQKPVRECVQQSDTNLSNVGKIEINSVQRHQTMSGVGAAFSELGGLAFASLPRDRQKVLLNSLFDVKDGAGFSMCRLPVGSSDFATNAYSYSETPEDFEMKAFTLARDERSIIPLVQAARRVNPTLALWASPWSPPGWMKVSGKIDHGGLDSRLRDEGKIYQAYALYFEKYLAGYQAHGLPIARLCPQNEMDCNPGYPGCLMGPLQLTKLVTGYLAPRLKAAQVVTEIWPGTFRESPKAPYATECMTNEAFRAVIGGLGIQYYNRKTVAELAKQYPTLRFMHTEAKCENGKNTVDQARQRFAEMVGCFNDGCDTYSYWNMLLDENQKSGWGWSQNSLVTIIRTKGEVRFNPDFQPVCLVSKFVRPGMVRVDGAYHHAGPSTFSTTVAAFVNEKKEIVVLAQNQSATNVVLDLNLDGRTSQVTLPADADCAIIAALNSKIDQK